MSYVRINAALCCSALFVLGRRQGSSSRPQGPRPAHSSAHPPQPLLFIWGSPPGGGDGGMRGGQEREQQAGGIRLPKGRPADRADVTGSDRRALAGAPGPSTSRGNHLNLTSTHLPEVCMVHCEMKGTTFSPYVFSCQKPENLRPFLILLTILHKH